MKTKIYLQLFMSLFLVSSLKAQESPTVPPPPPPPPPNTIISIHGLNGNNYGSYPPNSSGQTKTNAENSFVIQRKRRGIFSIRED